MSHDPYAEFDHQVLALIEQSPVGAVPATPSFQDALGRLRASHQVYRDADHHDGYVTARSLVTRPPIHANNLDAVISGAIDVQALEPNAKIFDRYVASLPPLLRAKAEGHRLVVAGKPVHHRKHAGVIAHDLVHTLFLVPGSGPNRGIPGNYLHGSVLQLATDTAGGGWAVHLHDRDDGAALYDAPTLQDAVAKLQEVFASAPFHLEELGALGFRPN